MIKEAARTYRDAKGKKITAVEWVKQHGGAKAHLARGNISNSPDLTYGSSEKKLPKLYLTGDKRYNFAQTSDKRIEIGRDIPVKGHLYNLENVSSPNKLKALRQNLIYDNRTAEPIYSHRYRKGRTTKWKDIGVYSDNFGNHTHFHKGGNNSSADTIKEYLNREKTKTEDAVKKNYQNMPDGGAAKLALSIAAATATPAIAYEIYSRIKNRKRKDDKNERD